MTANTMTRLAVTLTHSEWMRQLKALALVTGRVETQDAITIVCDGEALTLTAAGHAPGDLPASLAVTTATPGPVGIVSVRLSALTGVLTALGKGLTAAKLRALPVTLTADPDGGVVATARGYALPVEGRDGGAIVMPGTTDARCLWDASHASLLAAVENAASVAGRDPEILAMAEFRAVAPAGVTVASTDRYRLIRTTVDDCALAEGAADSPIHMPAAWLAKLLKQLGGVDVSASAEDGWSGMLVAGDGFSADLRVGKPVSEFPQIDRLFDRSQRETLTVDRAALLAQAEMAAHATPLVGTATSPMRVVTGPHGVRVLPGDGTGNSAKADAPAVPAEAGGTLTEWVTGVNPAFMVSLLKPGDDWVTLCVATPATHGATNYPRPLITVSGNVEAVIMPVRMSAGK